MKFSKKEFRQWLESKNSLARVGRPELRFYCPLCEFLKSQGAKNVQMSFTDRTVDGKYIYNPPWAVKFQHAACDFVNRSSTHRITAKRALSLL